MFFTYNQLKEHNARFINAFIDLKVTGWKSYADALNDYTSGYFKSQIEEMTSRVVSNGDNMKSFVKGAM